VDPNPYAASAEVPSNAVDARAAVRLPAMGLIVLALMTLVMQAFSLYVNPQLAAAREMDLMQILNFNAGVFAIFLVNVDILWGSIHAPRLGSWRSARVGAILACIPLCSPCFVLGIPFWDLGAHGSRQAGGESGVQGFVMNCARLSFVA
jgi:hypothetical protein